MLNDLKFIVRAWGRSRTTAVVLLLSLGLGTGANLVLYVVMDALLFAPPPWVSDSSRLAMVFTSQFNGMPLGSSSFEDFQSLAEAASSFASIAAFDDSTVTAVRGAGTTERARVAAVSTQFFSTIGLDARLDRILSASGEASLRPAIVSHAFWTALGTPAVGDELLLRVGTTEYRILAVAPEGFAGLQLGRSCDIWIPLSAPDRSGGRGDRRLSVFGRLANESGLDQAQLQLTSLSLDLAERFPDTNRGTATDPNEPRLLAALPYAKVDPASRRQLVLVGAVVFGVTSLLLVSACVNAGTLLLARSAARRREFAVKLALGADRRILVRQIVMEALLVALGGAGVGLLVAHWTAEILPKLLAPEDTAFIETALPAPLVAVTVTFACVFGVCFAIAPARHAIRIVDTDVLRSGSGAGWLSGGSRWGRTILVAGQIAISTVLLVGTGLLLHAVWQVLETEIGREGHRIGSALVRLPGVRHGDVTRGIRFHTRAAEAALSMEGAESVGWVATLPTGRGISQVFEFDVDRPGVREAIEVDVNVASGGYFQTMHVPLVEGRAFDAGDGALARPVALVNDALAERVFGSGAVGRIMRDADGTEYSIIGIVRSGRYRTFQARDEPMVYFPLSQRTPEYMHLVLRAREEADPLLRGLPDRLIAIDSGASVQRVVRFDEHVKSALTLERVLTAAVASSGVMALLLATLGAYGVIDDQVRRRTPEIGLRVALGANQWQIRRLVIIEGLAMAAAGSALGIGLAFIVAHTGRSFVDGVPNIGLASVTIVPIALIVVVLGGAALPTRRALAVSPTVAFRDEA